MILGALLAAASISIHLVSTPMSAATGGSRKIGVREIFSARSLQVAAIGAVSIVGSWLLLTSSLKGQAVGAAIVGGFLAGAVGKRAAPDQEPVLLFASPIVIIGLVQIGLAWTIADPGAAFVKGSIPNLVAVMPLDLAAGSLIGVALGVGMSRPAPAVAAPASAGESPSLAPARVAPASAASAAPAA
ncbi:MAG: hypothetical protein FJ253_06545 [Phycisphaerae bacterium]|nr:hypothetical protein [Phycisphaerae bacterium]